MISAVPKTTPTPVARLIHTYDHGGPRLAVGTIVSGDAGPLVRDRTVAVYLDRNLVENAAVVHRNENGLGYVITYTKGKLPAVETGPIEVLVNVDYPYPKTLP